MSIFEPLPECRCYKPDCYFCQMQGRTFTPVNIETRTKERAVEARTPEDIFHEVCKIADIEPDVVKSKNRTMEVLIPRQTYCLVAAETTKMTHKEIGDVINRDRTTVIAAIKRAKDMIYIKGGHGGYANLYRRLKSLLINS